MGGRGRGETRIRRGQIKMEMEVSRPDTILSLESKEGGRTWKCSGISLLTYELSSQTSRVDAVPPKRDG